MRTLFSVVTSWYVDVLVYWEGHSGSRLNYLRVSTRMRIRERVAYRIRGAREALLLTIVDDGDTV